MKDSSLIVINVIIKHHKNGNLKLILKDSMKV